MFMIFKNNRPAGTTKFNSYERARQYLRRKLRQLTPLRHNGQPAVTLASLGYSIKAV